MFFAYTLWVICSKDVCSCIPLPHMIFLVDNYNVLLLPVDRSLSYLPHTDHSSVLLLLVFILLTLGVNHQLICLSVDSNPTYRVLLWKHKAC